MNAFILACELNALATFDDISGRSSTQGLIPAGYGGLIWTNANYINASWLPASAYSTICTGYCLFVKNGAMIILPINGTTFILNSCTLGAPWLNLNATITAYYFGTLVNTTTVPLNFKQRMTFAPDWSRVSSVIFQSTVDLAVDDLSVTIQDTCAPREYFIQFDTHLTLCA
ncbi:unnamed protein product [Didymodactylos carnosus]|uniref:Uncharacterized protein n=1 Tax=Didymodactylos carnosus TaxID=1234261 RepID=A0A8S2Z550_9BILA|nr:unnamed protein product [Didymodactylos carnosus]